MNPHSTAADNSEGDDEDEDEDYDDFDDEDEEEIGEGREEEGRNDHKEDDKFDEQVGSLGSIEGSTEERRKDSDTFEGRSSGLRKAETFAGRIGNAVELAVGKAIDSIEHVVDHVVEHAMDSKPVALMKQWNTKKSSSPGKESSGTTVQCEERKSTQPMEGAQNFDLMVEFAEFASAVTDVFETTKSDYSTPVKNPQCEKKNVEIEVARPPHNSQKADFIYSSGISSMTFYDRC